MNLQGFAGRSGGRIRVVFRPNAMWRWPARARRIGRWLACITLAGGLAGCGGHPTAEYFDELQLKLRATGKLRTVAVADDAPYTAEDLARNFERVALHMESDVTVPGGESNWVVRPLRRWARPIRYSVLGSATTDKDRAEITELMGRISRLTGLEITEAETDVNFFVLITTPDERDEFEQEIAEINASVAETFNLWRRSPTLICFGSILLTRENRGQIVGAIVSIGSETRNLMREACIHEEIAQSMGLTNDHPEARPSIFNDDEEFALLTQHDEKLMRILYDPRLKPGMMAAEAMPIVQRIAVELVPGLPGAVESSAMNIAN